MGCGCNFGNNARHIEEKNELLNNELIQIEESIRGNPKLEASIIKIQSHFRGMNIRSQIKNYQPAPNSFDINVTSQSQVNESNNFHPYQTDKISREDLDELLKEYPALNDEIPVEINGPLLFEINNSIYFGEWDYSNNMRHGRGIQIWNEGSIYYGYWVKDKANIRGKLIHNDGDIYEGEWLDDKPNGKGIYQHKDGTLYEGEWKDDKQHGTGKEIWPDGAWYEGEYNEGKKHGKGKFHWSDNSEYIGTFENNNINGQGVYIFSDNRKYIGSWVNNKLEGRGIFTWPDGRKYEGEYKNDKKEGYGIFNWNDGKIYKGYWKEGKQDGEGEYYNPSDKRWRKGIWEKGRRVKWLD